MKYCSSCEKTKALSEFRKLSSGVHCKFCIECNCTKKRPGKKGGKPVKTKSARQTKADNMLDQFDDNK